MIKWIQVTPEKAKGLPQGTMLLYRNMDNTQSIIGRAVKTGRNVFMRTSSGKMHPVARKPGWIWMYGVEDDGDKRKG